MEFVIKAVGLTGFLLILISAVCTLGILMQFFGTMDERSPIQNIAAVLFPLIIILNPIMKDEHVLDSALFKRKVIFVSLPTGVLLLLLYHCLLGSFG